MKKLRIDLHNHTTLCNHATGTMEGYVLEAISKGIDIFGFSCHAPMNFDIKYRMSLEDMSTYEEEIFRLQDKYKNQIQILFAYEVDYLPPYIEPKVLSKPVDYFIGSVHFINSWGFDNPEFIGGYEGKDIDVIWGEYFDAISDMAKTRLFDVVGHLDLIKVFKYLPKKAVGIIAYDALKEIQKANMTIEINPAGLRKPIEELYPSKELLKIAYDLNIPITCGSDAHKIEQIGYGYEHAVALAKEVGYKNVQYFIKRVPQVVIF
ncbi:histidinol-phosphatase [Arcobacter sp. FWKO B]|uniref:histidinol-phosphatase n=1 Tax=Arcobacter sp. FWKO B TaxID=2593672 RepID=UPI0018A58BDF|nr:histidinol-phosphatase [Arcobacter sp. FWKO B]QOG12665.1 histidinol-phosphatase [Arcobacter sp. FWKO B]